MQIATFIAIVILAAGVYFNHKGQVTQQADNNGQQEVLSETSIEDVKIAEDDAASSESGDPSPTTPPTPIAEPTVASVPQSTSLTGFVFPGANVTSESNTSLKLESSGSPEEVTSWYKARIESLNMNVKSFVTTKANDKVLNKLVGADGTFQISVEISKEPGDASVTITVNLTS